MINFNFGGTIEMFDLDVDITIGDTKVGTQHLNGPQQMVMMQCQELVNNVAQDSRPMKIEMRGKKLLELPNGDTVEKPSKLIYANNLYVKNIGLDGSDE